jgi:hypothetical protein
MGVSIHRLDQRPDLVDRVYEVEDGWPEFMGVDPVTNALMWRVAHEFPQLPVHCEVEHDHAVYVEPNVWVRHEPS